jgi:hypothetical protein
MGWPAAKPKISLEPRELCKSSRQGEKGCAIYECSTVKPLASVSSRPLQTKPLITRIMNALHPRIPQARFQVNPVRHISILRRSKLCGRCQQSISSIRLGSSHKTGRETDSPEEKIEWERTSHDVCAGFGTLQRLQTMTRCISK